MLYSIIGRAEENNPEIAYESAIQNKIKKQAELKKAVSSIIHLRNKTEADLKDKKAKLEEIDIMLETALDDGDDEVAVVLLEEKDGVESAIAVLEEDLSVSTSKRKRQWMLLIIIVKISRS